MTITLIAGKKPNPDLLRGTVSSAAHSGCHKQGICHAQAVETPAPCRLCIKKVGNHQQEPLIDDDPSTIVFKATGIHTLDCIIVNIKEH